uniref:Ig-like domain-containing protein n=1 Tax=Pelusios castaneus TaxID=367368 RepID=A0A8C8RR79_9SAUR
MVEWGKLDTHTYLVQLVQSGSGMVKPKETLTLTCTVSGFSISTHSYVWNWIRQPPGKELEWVARIHPYNGNKWFATSLQSRTTISSDNSKNQFSLQLPGLLTDVDTITYYCAGETHNDREKQGLVQREEVDL